MMSGHGVALFPSSSVAIRAEALLERAGCSVRLVPTPREISSDCGVVVRFNWCDLPLVESTLGEGKVELLGLCPLDPPDSKRKMRAK